MNCVPLFTALGQKNTTAYDLDLEIWHIFSCSKRGPENVGQAGLGRVESMELRKSDRAAAAERVARSTRFMHTDEGWYFKTREGVKLGPYAEEFDAEISASLLIAALDQLDSGADATPVIQRFLRDPANAPMGQAPAQDKKPLNLAAIKRQRLLGERIPTFQKAWQAIAGLRG